MKIIKRKKERKKKNMCKKFRSTGNKIRLMATTSNPTRAKKPIQPDKKRNLTSKLITIITQNYNKRAERYAPAVRNPKPGQIPNDFNLGFKRNIE